MLLCRPAALGALLAAALAVTAVAPASSSVSPAAVAAPVITSPADGADLTGLVAVTILSDAPTVKLSFDGRTITRVKTSGGAATIPWGTYGSPSTTASLTATACDPYYSCPQDAPSSSIAVTVTNTAPRLIAPADGTSLTGPVTVTAEADEGAVEFRFGTGRWPIDTTPPYSAVLDAADFADGPVEVSLARCQLDTMVCAGPTSETVTYTVASLAPATDLVQKPVYFSPNSDGAKDTTTTWFTLAERQAVTWEAVRGNGVVVRGPVSLGVLSAGRHSVTWRGRDDAGARVPDGPYGITIRTTAHGLAGRAIGPRIVLDTTPPPNAVTNSGTTFYPYRDTYKDTFAPGLTVRGPVWATLEVRTGGGTVIHRSSVSPGEPAPRWNGRYSSGSLRPAGTYQWRVKLVDLAGNRSTSSWGTVNLSWKRLVPVTLTATAPATPPRVSRTTSSCATLEPSSFGASGLWLVNDCAPFVSLETQYAAEAAYTLTVAQAARYGKVSLQVYGRSVSGTSSIDGWFGPLVGGPRTTGQRDIPAGAAQWRTLVTDDGQVRGDRTVKVGLSATNRLSAPNDLDLRWVRVVVSAWRLG